MSIALYNPKYLESEGGRKTLNETDVYRFIWSHASWNLKVNEVKKFPDEVAEAMLKHLEFLIRVTPQNVAEINKVRAEKRFHCQYPGCDFATDHKVALGGHMRSHNISAESDKILEDIEEATPAGNYRAPTRATMTPEQQEGIPDTSRGPVVDKDGVEFYGKGLEEDSIS